MSAEQDFSITKQSHEDKTPLTNEDVADIYTQSTFGFKYIFTVAGSLFNFFARCLIFNVIVLFCVRDRFKEVFGNVLNIQLSVIEIIILVNVFLFRLLCKITGTRTKQSIYSDNKYDLRGFLRYDEIHNQYWNHENITYKDDETAYSIFMDVMPITKFLEINTHDDQLYRQNSKTDDSSHHKSIDEKAENVFSTTDGDVHKSYFSFHRRLKKFTDSQSSSS